MITQAEAEDILEEIQQTCVEIARIETMLESLRDKLAWLESTYATEWLGG